MQDSNTKYLIFNIPVRKKKQSHESIKNLHYLVYYQLAEPNLYVETRRCNTDWNTGWCWIASNPAQVSTTWPDLYN